MQGRDVSRPERWPDEYADYRWLGKLFYTGNYYSSPWAKQDQREVGHQNENLAPRFLAGYRSQAKLLAAGIQLNGWRSTIEPLLAQEVGPV